MANVLVKQPYLVQRMKFRTPPDQDPPGVDELLEMEYMGSSEFEWGALPKSLKRLTKGVEGLQVVPCAQEVINFVGQHAFLICDPAKVPEYSVYMEQMAKNEIGLKEMTNLDRMVTGKDWAGKPIEIGGYGNTQAWWDLDNDVLFTFGENSASAILAAIRQVRDRKKKEGKSEWY